MYIPCQIVDLSSLESQATSSDVNIGGFCCPCMRSRHDVPRRGRSHDPSTDAFQRETEDPEMIFSRHRAAVIAGHRFLSNWNLQNIAPPLPRMGPPPLPPRRLSSFFPPMEPMPPRRISVTSEQALGNINLLMNHGKRKEDERSVSRICDDVPPPHPSGIPGAVADEPKPSNLQAPRGSTTSLACPYLSPIDVAATSWEWDFGKSDSLRSQTVPEVRSPDRESGATDRVNIWGDPPVVKKGLLMQQREKMWSRWKERYFILTRDYLHCFRRLRNVYRFHITLSAMGQFIFKLRLANVEDIRWDTRRNICRIAVTIRHEPTILLRSSDDNVEALYHWYTLLQECICMSKIRRQAIRAFNTSSEEDTSTASASHPSQFSAAILNDNNSHYNNSTFTVDTSSAFSGSSGQTTDILEIYGRVGAGGGRTFVQGIPHHNLLSRRSNNNQNDAQIMSKLDPSNPTAAVVVHPSRNSSQGFYLHERPPSILGRSHLQIIKRFQMPTLDSELEVEDAEVHGIFEGLPKRCSNPTREMEVLSNTSTSQPSALGHPMNLKVSSSPIVDEVEEEENTIPDVEDDYESTAALPSRSESRDTLRDFVKMPWRSSSACLPPPSPNTLMMRDWRESNFENSSRLSAFPFPVPSRKPPFPQRSVSSFSRPHQPPPHGVIGGRKVLPTPWTRNNPTLQIGKGAAFSRSNVIVCPSKLSADVTYLRRV